MDWELHRDFLKAVSPALDGAREHCFVHEERPADAFCPVCEKLHCFECMSFDLEKEVLTCRQCRKARAGSSVRKSWQRIARMPFFYVLLIVMATLVAYTMGFRNPSIEKIQRKDAGRPWHERRAGKLWLQQAVRAKERTDQLYESGAAGEDVSKWAGLARAAFANARACWTGEEPELDLAIGEALMVGKAGDPEASYEKLRELDDSIDKGHPAYPSFLFHRGYAAWRTGHPESAIDDWKTVLKAANIASDALAPGVLLDEIFDLISGDIEAGMLYVLIRQACDTFMNEFEIRERILEFARKNNLEDALTGVR